MEDQSYLALDLPRRIQSRGVNRLGSATLFRISEEKRARCKDLYVPKTFCIGPFHREIQTKDMIDKKIDFLIDFLDRQGNIPADRHGILGPYLSKMRELEISARGFYWGNLVINPKEFSHMLLIDGVFILEVLLKHNDNTLKGEMTDYVIRNLKRDFILLENQIPFLVLEELLKLLYNSYAVNLNYRDSQICRPSLQHLAMKFFQLRTLPPCNESNDQIGHLLDLFYRGFVPVYRYAVALTQRQCTGQTSSRSIPSAVDLKEFGVNFEKGSNVDFLQVSFEKGTLTIPLLELDEIKTCIHANLVAFEEIKNVSRKPVTSLFYLFKSLIRNEQDLSILVRCGVIENVYGNDSDIRDLFQNICSETSLDPDNHYLSVEFKKVWLYYNTKWRRWWGVFKRDYFRWPWSVVTFSWSLLVPAFVMVKFYWNVKQQQ